MAGAGGTSEAHNTPFLRSRGFRKRLKNHGFPTVRITQKVEGGNCKLLDIDVDPSVCSARKQFHQSKARHPQELHVRISLNKTYFPLHSGQTSDAENIGSFPA